MLSPVVEVTKSLSNLLKGIYTKQTEERVIDYNEVISNKIESFRSKMRSQQVEADGFVNGLNAAVVENLITEDGKTENSEDAAALLTGQEKEQDNGINKEELKLRAENIISDANVKAEEIITAARKEADQVKKNAYDSAFAQGKQKGYEEGSAKAQAEYQTLIDGANAELERLEKEYTERYSGMEKELVDTLMEVFSKVTHTIAEDNREIVLHLINQVMNQVEATGDFLIRVSKEDYPFLVENQGKIYCASPKDINISILEDSALTKNQCVIETDGGIFDCSLDIQLEQLIKDIKLLSCM